MSKLVPTPVVDKNGKLTTIHKKASAAPSASRLDSIAPTLGSTSTERSVAKEYKPTATQTTPFISGYPVRSREIDPALYPLLVHGANTMHLNIKTNDVSLYETLSSFKDTTNALACLSVNNFKVPDAAFLAEHHLNHLANTDDEGRKRTMRSALERRIPAKEFIDFERRYETYKDLPTYLDAAQTYSIPSFNKVKDLVDEVRRGSILFSDLMTVGPKPINKLRRYGDVIGMMTSLADGSADFTAEEMKSIFTKCTSYASVVAMTTLLEKYGGEYAASIEDPQLAHDTILLCDGDNQEYKPALDYIVELRSKVFRNFKEVYELFRAGVDIDFAASQSKEFDKVPVRQIIALHEGISKPVSGGWL